MNRRYVALLMAASFFAGIGAVDILNGLFDMYRLWVQSNCR